MTIPAPAAYPARRLAPTMPSVAPTVQRLRPEFLMRALFYSLPRLLPDAPVGVLAHGGTRFLASMFFLPLGIDFIVIIMAARKPELFWLYAILATVGFADRAPQSRSGSGAKVGEHGLARLVKPSRLERIQQRVSERAAVTVGALAMIPPPFPFTASCSTSGACRRQRVAFSRHARRRARWCASWSKARWPRTTAAGSSRGCSRPTFTIIVGVDDRAGGDRNQVSAVARLPEYEEGPGRSERSARRSGKPRVQPA